MKLIKMQNKSYKKRLVKLVTVYLIACAVGIAYAIFYNTTGFGIPCIFHLITGLNCISCGITRMVVYILQGKFYEAYCANRLLFVTLPVFAFYIIRGSMQYVKKGKVIYSRTDKVIFVCFIIIAGSFGIVRNFDVLFNWQIV